MIINSLNLSLSFRDEFEENLEREDAVDALMTTLESAATKHPSLIQYSKEDSLLLVNKLKNVIYDLVELTDELFANNSETPEELEHRRELIDQLSFYLGRDTVAMFLDYLQW